MDRDARVVMVATGIVLMQGLQVGPLQTDSVGPRFGLFI